MSDGIIALFAFAIAALVGLFVAAIVHDAREAEHCVEWGPETETLTPVYCGKGCFMLLPTKHRECLKRDDGKVP